MDSAAATSIVKDWSRGVVEFNVNVKGVVTGYNLHTIDVLEKRSIRVSRKEIKELRTSARRSEHEAAAPTVSAAVAGAVAAAGAAATVSAAVAGSVRLE
ncbi:hypothetical protein LWI29_022399 [Acer saccharum]|uniref:Uncharacterized protein n=1 Tax=Acer saccharum TaxID=4024 RepID=A0AA39VLD8_ACESA|nr:hypothetical protein LWI29_022399 [Acer saccharum]